MGINFHCYETHISIQMQFLSDNGLYGFACIKSDKCLLRTNSKFQSAQDYIKPVSINIDASYRYQQSFDTMQSSLHRSPIDKQSYHRIEIDMMIDDIANMIDDRSTVDDMPRLKTSALMAFWIDEYDRRSMHKIDVDLCWCDDDSMNTQACDTLHYTAVIDTDAIYNQINQSIVDDGSIRVGMPLTTMPVDKYKIAKYRQTVRDGVSGMISSMRDRFREYGKRKKHRDKYNFAVDSDEDVDSNEEGFEVLQHNKLHVKNQYLHDFTGYQRRLKFDDGISEVDESKAQLLLDLKNTSIERKSQLQITTNLIINHSQHSSHIDDNHVSSNESIVLSFNDRPPIIPSITINHQMYD